MRNAALRAINLFADSHDAGNDVRVYEFAGVYLEVRWKSEWLVGPKLEMIEHRRAKTDFINASIDIVAGENQNLEELMPQPSLRRSRVLLDSSEVYYFWSPDGAGSLTLFDRKRRRGLVWYLSLETVTSWETSKPLLQTIKAVSLDKSWVPVHAAAAAWKGKGILFTGPSRTGKSSTALACVDAGWKYIADDFLILAGNPVRAENIFASARVRQDMFLRLQRAVSIADYLSHDSGETKAEVNMTKLPGIEIGGARLYAILIPCRSEFKETTITPTRRSVALRALAATTLVNLPGEAAATHKKIEDYVQELPCYMLHLGTEFTGTTRALSQWVDTL